jgi:hypothetical protein
MLACGQLKEIGNRFVIELWNRFFTRAGKNQSQAEQSCQNRLSQPVDLSDHNWWPSRSAIGLNIVRLRFGTEL